MHASIWVVPIFLVIIFSVKAFPSVPSLSDVAKGVGDVVNIGKSLSWIKKAVGFTNENQSSADMQILINATAIAVLTLAGSKLLRAIKVSNLFLICAPN